MGDVGDEAKRETQRVGGRRTRWEEVPATPASAAATGAAAAAAAPAQTAAVTASHPSPLAVGGAVASVPVAHAPTTGVAAMKSSSEGLAALKFNLQAAASAAREALEKAKKAALMQRALQEQLRESRQQQRQQQQQPNGPAISSGVGPVDVGEAAATAAAALAARGAGAGAGQGLTGIGGGLGAVLAGAGRGLTLRTLLGRGGLDTGGGLSSSLLLLGPAAAAAQLANAQNTTSQEQQRLAVTTAAVAAAAAAAQQQQQQKQQDSQLQLLQLLRQQQLPLSSVAANMGGLAANATGGLKGDQQQTAATNAGGSAQERPRPLRFDRFGREIDEEGRVVPLSLMPHSSLKINQRTTINSVTKAEGNAVGKRGGVGGAARGEPEDITQADWYDPNIYTRTSYTKRKRKALQFIEPGTYLRQEEQMHAYHRLLLKQQRREQQRQQKREGATATAADRAEEKLKVKGIGVGEGRVRGSAAAADGNIPTLSKAAVDAGVGGEAAAAAADNKRKREKSTEAKELGTDQSVADEDEESDEEDAVLVPEFSLRAWKFEADALVEHPVPLKPTTDPTGSVIINMYLTVEERKRLRRRKRQEKEKEKQDKIRMGLMPPPPPKVKLTNLMRVLGDQAIADPSKVHKEVKAQMARRLEEHEERNAARKLSAEARRKKQISKWKVKPGSCEVHVLVFAIDVVVSRRNIYKMDTNAQQLHLTGVAAILQPPLKSVVVVEGSFRAVKKFKALMMRRMKWTEADSRPANDDDDDAGGTAKSSSFPGWSVQRATDAIEGRKIFKSSHLEHCWDTVQKYRDVRADYG